ncbi:PAS domain-containing protein [Lichenicoccus sp.]|uniref:PAS domain-containing protein n=1 Tax=Lichenicoccus sp. TaxID=2781899 RepID=UPI003D124A60
MTLIEQRHPRLGRLVQLWRAHCDGGSLPLVSALVPAALADLAPLTVLLTRTTNGGQQLTITASGAEVDALYGESLAGAPATRLTPTRGDAEEEARSAIETARPVVIEDELGARGRSCRVARVYLPLANDDGSPDVVLCGVVAVA